MHEDFAHVDTWLFDMDNTLYDANAHVFVIMRHLMMQYMTEKFSVSPDEAATLRDGLWRRHGTTLRGLMNEHQVDPHDFLRRTHDIDVTPVQRCEALIKGIARLPGRKYIYTNSTHHFAEKIAARLGIDTLLDGIFAIEDAEFSSKPMPESYEKLVVRNAIAPGAACMFEDSERNLKPARDLGMTTVWVCPGEEQAAPAYVQHITPSLKDWLGHHT